MASGNMSRDDEPTNAENPSPQEREGFASERLDGWKAIAAFLCRDIRTVQRWELSEGLPIHRLEHKRRASAYAFVSELEAWQRQQSPQTLEAHPPGDPAAIVRQHRRRTISWLVGALAVVVALLGVGFLVWERHHGQSSSLETADSEAYAEFAQGRALYGARRYREAVERLEHAVTVDATFGPAWALLAKAYGRLAQPVWAGGPAAASLATAAAERAARFAPGLADTHIAMALAARSQHDMVSWRREAQRAVDIDPRAAEAYALLGDSYSAVNYACTSDQDPERADAYYRRALELMPDLISAITNRAGNLRRMGRYAECIEQVDGALRLFNDETPLLATRGGCRLLQGDLAGAIRDIEPLRDNPKIAPAGRFIYLGLLELKRGNATEGIRYLESVLGFDSTAASELMVAETYGLAGDVTRATTHLRRAFAIDAACAGTVATSLAFGAIRHAPEVERLLREHGIS
jgi:tetratricopeptide (TPR) repeat protein